MFLMNLGVVGSQSIIVDSFTDTGQMPAHERVRWTFIAMQELHGDEAWSTCRRQAAIDYACVDRSTRTGIKERAER
jgi:hypothetical protein